jgi:hypothetical protein
MDLNIVDDSYGTDLLSARLAQTAHALIPQPGKAARHTVLQVDIINGSLDKNSHATVSVLTEALEWTVLLSLPASAWRHRMSDPAGTVAGPKRAMEAFAGELFDRAVTILGPEETMTQNTKKKYAAWNVYSASAAAGGLVAGVLFLLHAPGYAYGLGILAAALLTDLSFTLAQRRRRTKSSQAPAPAIVRTPRLLKLAVAEAHLLGLRTAYKTGRTSGHPEDSLWDIEDAEKWVARLRAGTD